MRWPLSHLMKAPGFPTRFLCWRLWKHHRKEDAFIPVFVSKQDFLAWFIYWIKHELPIFVYTLSWQGRSHFHLPALLTAMLFGFTPWKHADQRAEFHIPGMFLLAGHTWSRYLEVGYLEDMLSHRRFLPGVPHFGCRPKTHLFNLTFCCLSFVRLFIYLFGNVDHHEMKGCRGVEILCNGEGIYFFE